MGNRIRPATPLDIVRLSVPPTESLRLDLAQQLLSPHHPWRGFLPNWLGLGEPLHTLLDWGEHGLLACAQALAQDTRWEVRYLSVWRAGRRNIAAVWEELLLALGQMAGRRGAIRLLARLPAEEYLPPFQRAGFVLFAQETILLWDGSAPFPVEPLPALQPMQPQYLGAVQRLHANLTPPVVQHAEGYTGNSWQPRRGVEGWVWPADDEARAYLQRQRGHQGTLLEILLEPAFRQQAGAVLAQGLVGVRPPVYLLLRSYQGELVEVARRMGFRPYAGQLLLAKHLAVRSEERQPAGRAAERHLEAAPSTPAVGKVLSMEKVRRSPATDHGRWIAPIG